MNPRTVSDYFARVLRRGQLDEVTFKDDPYVAVPRTQLAASCLSRDDAAKLFAAHDRARGSSSGSTKASGDRDSAAKDANDGASMPVAISLVSVGEEGGGHSGLLLLEAKLYRDGRLEPVLEVGRSPWVPAERLTAPSVTDREVMVGDLRDFWRYSESELGADVSQTESMVEAFQLAEKLFAKVAKQTIDGFVAANGQFGLFVEHEYCYVQESNRIDAASQLLNVYDFLGREEELASLVERLALGWQGSRSDEAKVHQNDGLFDAARVSCGSMSDGFPLTDSQRRAVHAFLMGDDGEITAVSGPPGTGKTTMLQSIVANLVTCRALEKADPPVIVGTSTNNQAVTNIISSFSSVTKDEPGPLDFRWLPQEVEGQADVEGSMKSLAVYCPSKAKLSGAKAEYLVEQRDRSETYAAYSEVAYTKAAVGRFLQHAHAFLGKIHEIPQVQEWIHEALVELDGYRVDLLSEMRQNGASDHYLFLCREVAQDPLLTTLDGVGDLQECTNLEDLDRKLDVTLRYAEFWLAVHYFEAQWLIADHLGQDERWQTNESVNDRYWKQAAALTPCFVMTVYQVPKYFQSYTRRGEPKRFDIGRIDLLIVDEAGQVDTPLGLPCFALAKRALVVGDENQLSPVWALDSETDREVAEGAGISSAVWEDLQERGLTCSQPSSLMRAASHASRWRYGGDHPGLFLAEHFRCHPRIIGFCNELLYDGLLQPNRKASASKLGEQTQAFQFTEVPGSQDSRLGSSRTNQVEAQAIASWIVANYAHYFTIYHSDEPDPNKKVPEDALIGVVTPFRAQAELISRELQHAVQAPDAPAGLPDQLWKKITVGTAHRLQGAERPIVLFSAVYGLNSPKATFIDANLPLMNVAVSRAKDLLIVFAASNRWGEGEVFSLMTKYARQTELSEADAEETQASEVEAEETQASGADAEEPQGAEPDAGASDVPPLLQFASQVAQPTSGGLTVSEMLKGWRTAGVLRAGDEGLGARALNLRLHEAGVLDGEPGAWKPSRLARLLGLETVQRHDSKGGSFPAIEYAPQLAELLRGLYLAGKL